ncbi:MAG: 2Fe-2S iron-sulfur cluster-binding protein [Pseudolabrys sp.]
MKIRATDLDGAQHERDALPGWRVMEIIRDWDIPVKAECGGACGTCHVYVDEPWFDKLPEKTDNEIDQLAVLGDCKPNPRLACPVLMSEELGGLAVKPAPNSAP